MSWDGLGYKGLKQKQFVPYPSNQWPRLIEAHNIAVGELVQVGAYVVSHHSWSKTGNMVGVRRQQESQLSVR